MKHTTNIMATLAILFTASLAVTTLLNGFVDLPVYIQRFDDLTRENIDVLRYTYKGAAFGLVYGIYNKINQKIYVGSTTDPVTRFYEHLTSGINSNTGLQRAIKKYGLECFSVIIFQVLPYAVGLTKSDLFAIEQKYLDLFPKKQKYNIAKRADGGGRPMTPAERAAVSKRLTGVNVGRAPINKGTTLTDAAKQVIWNASAHRRHTVYIYDEMFNLVGMYPSISEAVRIEKTQKNTFMAHMKKGTLWRGFYVTKVCLH
jgi:hypothetical protein